MKRDVFSHGFGVAPESQDACLLFNILHCEEPVGVLTEAARVVRPTGFVYVIHWRYDPSTPRGPDMEIRPRPEQIVDWGVKAGLVARPGPRPASMALRDSVPSSLTLHFARSMRTGTLRPCWTRMAVVPRTRSATNWWPCVPMATRSQPFVFTQLMISLTGSP